MDKSIITFSANEQNLQKTGGIGCYASDTVSYIEAHFTLGENWSGYDSIRAVWFNDYKTISTVLDPDGVCIVPHEVLVSRGKVMVNLVGSVLVSDELSDRLTTFPCEALKVSAKAKINGSETAPITPSQFEQFVAMVKDDADRAEAGAESAEGFSESASSSAEAALLSAQASEASAVRSANSASDSADSATASANSASDAQECAQNAQISATNAENAKDEAIDARDEIRSMNAEATTLSAGSEATASYANGILSLGIPRGADGNGIESITLTGTSGAVKTYTILFTDGTSTTFEVTDGEVTQAQLDAAIAEVTSEIYYHETDTDAFYWRPNARVNSRGSTYATGQTYWTGLYKTDVPERTQLEVIAGSKFYANEGYTLDYAVRVNGVAVQFERGISAGTEITVEQSGILLLAVTNGSSATSPAENAKAVAKAGLTIDLITKPISEIVLQNTADIETLEAESQRLSEDVESLKADERKAYDALTDLVSAQKEISDDWHFGFINVAQGMGLGSNHVIPATKTIWSASGTIDLDQKGVWMSDGVHPFKGDGVTDMYARTIAPQLAMIVPSYRDGVGVTSPSVWSGRNILWMGTSIPAGSDPEAGEGTGSTYPALVASILGATSINKSKGSSCVRINASTGEYTGMIFPHFARALTRTVAECDEIAANWNSIKSLITYAPDTLSASDIATMKSHSFENLIVPYLDGTNTMPDLFVIDHGHNDVRPKGVDGKNDLWIEPSTELIADGTLAEDTYMTANNYANLKTALNNDLSGITDLNAFAASLNRNCFKGAMNFLITLILRYNPYARIVIIGDYN